jgi:O-antigen/teichoic acid export membrane protein
MTAIEKPQRQLIPTIAYIAMNLLFSIPLVYYFGIIGAALTILIANVTNVIISRYIFTREKGIIEAGIHDKYSMVILKTLTVQLTISIISFIPIYFIIETIASIYIQFALALFFGIFVSIIITMYLFARGAIQEDESEKFFSILPKFLRPLARKYRLLSRRVWGSR